MKIDYETLREFRRSRPGSLTVTSLARLTGWSPSGVSRFERGLIPNTPEHRIAAYADALGVTPATIRALLVRTLTPERRAKKIA